MRSALAAALTVVLYGCVTTRASEDARLDDSTPTEALNAKTSAKECGPDGKGDIVILDARTGGPMPCTRVTISATNATCSADCEPQTIFSGRTNAQGQAAITKAFEQANLTVVADGYAPSAGVRASLTATRLIELELAPEGAFWLKVLDAEGNYLPDVSVSFKQGDEVVATLRSNVLANLIFTQRQPFAGQPVVAEAQSYQPVTINGAEDLGRDGHTLVLKK